jgi:spore maturation protein CgeB
MSQATLLILGNFSASCHVGSMFGRAADTLGVPWRPLDYDPYRFAPSYRTLPGRVFLRLSGGRPWEWWRFNRQIAEEITRVRPRFLLVSGSFPLLPEVFHTVQATGTKTINFATDDPWARHLRHNKAFFANIPHYDLIVSTKARAVADFLGAGARSVKHCTYSYDPYWHRLPDPVPDSEREAFRADLSFIGTGNRERSAELATIARLVPGVHRLFGNAWQRLVPAGWTYHGEALDNRFRLAVHESKLNLALLRRGSRDDSTQRTYEIAPCGGTGIYEDTPEHRAILAGYPELGFFHTIQDLAEKCRRLLADDQERFALRDAGIRLLVNDQNTFAARLRSILHWIDAPALR